MTARGPQHRTHVEVRDARGERVASATCFFSTFEDAGAQRWRGFLAELEPAGALAPGAYEVVLDSGAHESIEVTEVRTEPREQVIFRGLGAPPPIDIDS